MQLRKANIEDTESVLQILSSSRLQYLPYAKSPHTREETLYWVKNILIPTDRVVIGQSEGVDIGVLATSINENIGWIDQLYLTPGYVDKGFGTELLKHALSSLPRPVRLWTFQQNVKAIRFYERNGFAAIKHTNGEENEENCPDILYEIS